MSNTYMLLVLDLRQTYSCYEYYSRTEKSTHSSTTVLIHWTIQVEPVYSIQRYANHRMFKKNLNAAINLLSNQKV